MTSTRTIRAGIIASFALLILLALGANQHSAHAESLPFENPPSGTDVLCYINELDERHSVRIIHPPVPGFRDVGECGDLNQGEDDTDTDDQPAPACSNGEDDDGDGFTDADDPNCHTDSDPTNPDSYDPDKDNEAGTLPACWNGEDDDGDGLTDWSDDPGCTSSTDTSEEDDTGNEGSVPQCSDGTDNDGDELVDSADPGCHTDFDAENPDSYDPQGSDESASAHIPQCSDGIDNDSDGVIDLVDGGCGSPEDDDESNNNPSSGGGGGGGGGSSRSKTPAVLGAATTTPQYSVEEIAACDTYLTAFIKFGNTNDMVQVERLQRFLNDFEGASLAVDGVYGTSTLAAVHAFQSKYAADILTPWGIQESTGFVYLTTRKTVNEIFCRHTKLFPLTEEQQRLVDEARARITQESATPQNADSVQSASASSDASESEQSESSTETEGEQVPSRLLNVFDFLRGFWSERHE